MKLVKCGKEKSGPLAPVSPREMPFGPLRRLQGEIDRLFEDSFGRWLSPKHRLIEATLPVVDVYVDKKHVVVKAELPGMTKDEFDVYLSGENLNIAGERKLETEEKPGEACQLERYFGRFHRSIPLPVAVDASKVSAHYNDGILTIICPKTEEARRKQIEIKVD